VKFLVNIQNGIKTKVILPGSYVILSVFVYHVIIKTKVILPGVYVTLSVFVYHLIIKTKVILPGSYVILSVFVYHVIIKTNTDKITYDPGRITLVLIIRW
jgi:hypothetical protein